MELPLPTFSFKIPSIHDGNQLDCRIYLPPAFQNIESAAAWPNRGAIIAHPYAPLGGCYDDPVVGFVGSELLQSDCIVGTFNFRGAGVSEGRTSWTAKPELGDYVSFYGFMLQYLHHLKLAFPPSDPADPKPPNTGQDESPDLRLILGGYSYGSLIASHVPSPEVILDIFRPGPTSAASASTYKPTPKSEIGKASIRIATSTLEKLQMTHSHSVADTKPTALTTSISYLLVSPLLPPISHLLTSFSTLSLNVKAHTGSDTRIPCRPTDQQNTHHTLALFGDQDTFTSAEKLEKWSDEMAHMPRSQFQFWKIDGAGHFWREDGVETRARHALKVWLGQL